MSGLWPGGLSAWSMELWQELPEIIPWQKKISLWQNDPGVAAMLVKREEENAGCNEIPKKICPIQIKAIILCPDYSGPGKPSAF